MKEKAKIWHEVIKEARLSKRLTQTDVANLLGVTLRTYQRIESGRQWPSYDYFQVLCKELGITITIP